MSNRFQSARDTLAAVTKGIKKQHWIALAIVLGAVVIACAIAFDDASLTEYQLDLANLLIRVAGGTVVLFGALRYIWERQQELAWQKTRFMAELFKEFEEDENLCRGREILDYWHDTGDDSRIRAALEPMSTLSTNRQVDRSALDRYLDFFDHLYTYLFITETLGPEDASSFSGYVLDILDCVVLSDFAYEWGYEDVLRLGLYYDAHPRIAGRETTTEELKAAVEKRRAPL